jgi:hypothetical protein
MPNVQGAGLNPFQQASAAQAGALAGTSQAMNYAVPQSATRGFQSAIDYNPQQVRSTSYQAANPAAMVGQFQNPYESQVVQQTLADIGEAQDISLNQLGAQAQAANAFGGSRQGVAEAQTRLGYGKQAANMVGNLRQQGFNTALGAAQNLANAQNQAAQFGAQSGMTSQQLNQAAGLTGANLNLQGSQAMSNADLAAQRMRLGAANQLSNLGRTSFGYGTSIQDRMAAQGAQQRGIQQQLIDQAQAEQTRYRGGPAQGLNTMLGTVTGQTGNLTGQTVSQNPGLFNYLQVASQFGQ